MEKTIQAIKKALDKLEHRPVFLRYLPSPEDPHQGILVEIDPAGKATQTPVQAREVHEIPLEVQAAPYQVLFVTADYIYAPGATDLFPVDDFESERLEDLLAYLGRLAQIVPEDTARKILEVRERLVEEDLYDALDVMLHALEENARAVSLRQGDVVVSYLEGFPLQVVFLE